MISKWPFIKNIVLKYPYGEGRFSAVQIKNRVTMTFYNATVTRFYQYSLARLGLL